MGNCCVIIVVSLLFCDLKVLMDVRLFFRVFVVCFLLFLISCRSGGLLFDSKEECVCGFFGVVFLDFGFDVVGLLVLFLVVFLMCLLSLWVIL